MRVGLVIYGSLETLSGGYLYDRLLVENLRSRGDQVMVISLSERSYLGRLLQNLPLLQPQDLTGLDIDILLQDELCHPSLIAVNRILRRTAAWPVISIVHHLLGSEPGQARAASALYRSVERAYLGGVDGFIFNSETTREVVEAEIGPGRPSIVASPGANRLDPDLEEDEIVRRACSPGPCRIIFLGNVIRRKGLDVLLAALAELSDLDWELTVVGSLQMEPRYAGRMPELARNLGIAARVVFRGPLTDEALAGEMRSHHLMALPSYYEGYGIAYLESMGFGMPVIGCEAGAAPEVIAAGTNGFLIPPGDHRALASALSAVAGDRRRLLEMSLSASNRYRTSPRWEETAEKIRSFLRNVIHSRGLTGVGTGGIQSGPGGAPKDYQF